MPRASDDAATRVRSLLALDAAGVMRRLEGRRVEMIASFSRKRDRRALLSVIHSWFDTARFDELVLLEVRQQMAAAAFYEELSDLRWYFEHTEDMPGTAERVVMVRMKRLALALEALFEALGDEAMGGAAPGKPAPGGPGTAAPRKKIPARAGKAPAAPGRKATPARKAGGKKKAAGRATAPARATPRRGSRGAPDPRSGRA